MTDAVVGLEAEQRTAAAERAEHDPIDRLRLGYVVDFIHFHVYDKFHWPTFNIADTTITIGVALLLLDGLRRPEAETKPDARPERAGTGNA